MIAEVFGEMVTRRVQRHHALHAQAGTISDRDLLAALDRAIQARTDLGHLIDRIEHRLTHPNVPRATPARPSDPSADGPVTPPSTEV